MEPRIAERLTAIRIGAPTSRGAASGQPRHQYNLNIDLAAAQVVVNDSPIPLWQVPRNACRQALVSMAELQAHVRPMGRIGEYLYDHFQRIAEFAIDSGRNLGETYILGDSPLVLLSTLQSDFHPDLPTRPSPWPAPAATSEKRRLRCSTSRRWWD